LGILTWHDALSAEDPTASPEQKECLNPLSALIPPQVLSVDLEFMAGQEARALNRDVCGVDLAYIAVGGTHFPISVIDATAFYQLPRAHRALTASLPLGCYYDGAVLHLWPAPAQDYIVTVQARILQVISLDTEFECLPGAHLALQYNLAEAMAPRHLAMMPPGVSSLATRSRPLLAGIRVIPPRPAQPRYLVTPLTITLLTERAKIQAQLRKLQAA
jgi:hypothetical protein